MWLGLGRSRESRTLVRSWPSLWDCRLPGTAVVVGDPHDRAAGWGCPSRRENASPCRCHPELRRFGAHARSNRLEDLSEGERVSRSHAQARAATGGSGWLTLSCAKVMVPRTTSFALGKRFMLEKSRNRKRGQEYGRI